MPLFPITPMLGALMCLFLLMSLMAQATTRNFFLIYLAGGIAALLRLRHVELEARQRRDRARRGTAARSAAPAR